MIYIFKSVTCILEEVQRKSNDARENKSHLKMFSYKNQFLLIFSFLSIPIFRGYFPAICRVYLPFFHCFPDWRCVVHSLSRKNACNCSQNIDRVIAFQFFWSYVFNNLVFKFFVQFYFAFLHLSSVFCMKRFFDF